MEFEHICSHLKDDIDDALKGAVELKTILENLMKEMSPVYDKYKPFKDIEVGMKLILRTHIYEKREPLNMVGNMCNCFDITKGQYDYIPDYEWVIQLD